jgi:cellulose biosynthesis protein BcsQ
MDAYGARRQPQGRVAATLAAALAWRGERVALADADRQRSALGWLGRRPERVRPGTFRASAD